jgi:hypothetical protein
MTEDGQYGALSTTLTDGRATTLHLRLNRGARALIARSRTPTRRLVRGQALDQAGNRGPIVTRSAAITAARR